MTAQVDCSRAHENAFRANPLLECFRDVSHQELLNLHSMRECLHKLHDSTESGDDFVGLIGHVDGAEKRQEVMVADAGKIDALLQDDPRIIANMCDVVQDCIDVSLIAAK